MKTFIALALLSSFAAAPAMAETFTRDGVTYNYTVSSVGNAKLISGTNGETGEAFRLRVKNDRVRGRVGRNAVDFRMVGADAVLRSAMPVLASK